MVSKYWMLMKTDKNRFISRDSYVVVGECGQEEADCEAMEMIGKRLVDEARAIRRMRAAKAA